MVGKPTAYRTNRNESFMHAEHLQRRIKMNTLLQNYIKVRQYFERMTTYVKVGNKIGKHVTIIY